MVKTTGDGALVEFPSAVDAVRCAVDIQRGMATRNANIPEDRRTQFRVGNIGDIIIDQGDILPQRRAKQVVLTVVARLAHRRPPDCESCRRRNHKPPKSRIPKRKKTAMRPRLSCNSDYLFRSNHGDQSIASEFFTDDTFILRISFIVVLPAGRRCRIGGGRLCRGYLRPWPRQRRWAGLGGGVARYARYGPARRPAHAGTIQQRTIDAAVRNHRDRSRGPPERGPHERHGVARFHQRDNFDDAPQAGIYDHPNFFAGSIDRTHGIDRSLADRASEVSTMKRAACAGPRLDRNNETLRASYLLLFL
jgi:hypothetical protein